MIGDFQRDDFEWDDVVGWKLKKPLQEHLRQPALQPVMRGCVCPAGSEATCQGFACPRKPLTIT